MSRFLSAEWFEEVRRHAGNPANGHAGDPANRFVIEQVVRATPDGDVRYRVVVDEGGARIVAPGVGDHLGPPPDLTITSDWDTAAGLATGELSAQAALADGRLRIGGSLERLPAAAVHLTAQDALPEAVRRTTTFER
jgi:SCP-2 sterol transfer family